MTNSLALPDISSNPSTGRLTPPIGLLDLPPEILDLVIWKLSPVSLSAFSRTCQVLHDYINGLGDLLWRDLFLSIWDDSRLADEAIMAIRVPWFCISHLANADLDEDQRPEFHSSSELLDENWIPPTQFRWRDQVQRRISAEIFLSKLGMSSCISEEKIPARRHKSIRTLLSTLDTTPSASSTFIRSRNVMWLEKLLHPSNFSTEFFMRHFLHDPDIEPSNVGDRQLTAELQVHFFNSEHKLSSEHARLSRLNARAYVYNIQNYKEEGWHGPWRMTERGMEPNWVHLAACQRVVLENVAQRKVTGHNYPTLPTGATAVWGGSSKTMAVARKNNPSRISGGGFNDWAGVEGVWRRLVCFMDYRDFHEYNVHSRRPSGGLDPSVFKHKLFNEATRIITMTLKIVRSEPAAPPFEHRPILHFTGFSVANDTMISGVHGFVCMTANGYVRWRLVTRYDTEDRWVTEALGDAGSAAGFLGTWTGNNHEPDDPAGPTWLWKIADVTEMPQAERLNTSNEGYIFPDVFFGGNIFGDVESEDDDESGDDQDVDEEDEENNDSDEEMEESDFEDDEDDDDDGSSSDEMGYDPPNLPTLQPLPSLYD